MRKTLTAVLGAAVVGGIALTALPASAADTVTVRPGDVDTSESRAAGHNEFLRDGVHVYTDDNSSEAKAAAYFAVDKPLSEVTTATMNWHNTPGYTAIPGQQIVFDADSVSGTNNDYNILVGEPVYTNGEGEIEWWLTNGSSGDAKDADPSGTNDGGNGSAYFGTLAEWSAALPDAKVLAGGWSLGSGIEGDGIVRDMTYGDTTYTFTKDAAPLPVERPVADATISVPKPKVAKVKVTATQPEGTQPTAKGAYYKVLKVNPRTGWTDKVAHGRIFAGTTDRVRVQFPHSHKRMQVQVISYGEVIAKHGVRVR